MEKQDNRIEQNLQNRDTLKPDWGRSKIRFYYVPNRHITDKIRCQVFIAKCKKKLLTIKTLV